MTTERMFWNDTQREQGGCSLGKISMQTDEGKERKAGSEKREGLKARTEGKVKIRARRGRLENASSSAQEKIKIKKSRQALQCLI